MSSSKNDSKDMDNKRKRLTQACELCRRKKVRKENKPQSLFSIVTIILCEPHR